MNVNCRVIEIIWEGPFSAKDLKDLGNKKGLYQIYGTHPTYGSNSLLYIGKTEDNFTNRISSHHNDWLKYEYDEIKIYLGTVHTSLETGEDATILLAEKLLIYYCVPGYNSNELADLRIAANDIILLNYGRIARLPTEVSTVWYHSKLWDEKKWG
jgi:hypothetical protein